MLMRTEVIKWLLWSSCVVYVTAAQSTNTQKRWYIIMILILWPETGCYRMCVCASGNLCDKDFAMFSFMYRLFLFFFKAVLQQTTSLFIIYKLQPMQEMGARRRVKGRRFNWIRGLLRGVRCWGSFPGRHTPTLLVTHRPKTWARDSSINHLTKCTFECRDCACFVLLMRRVVQKPNSR